ncbi:hypothetical protein CKC_03705 [Candidatus Liberibacter solanacearum CLso-ZC1]|uniref:Uncharacterized protein n=1 Tax=Liberibacter solanacearum (strain CLso-ZC1) TaxID=658172 RepID=E4UBI4_LIBSC|nr:hypothetical protein [Candidatus Liberibacter solanacearum]ADR52490.1 hypothetical protein CKC_03705 [Candidatus Liberibacter solanacearum CLso-ZC1]
MTIGLQEQFKNYVFEDVKERIDEWVSIGNYSPKDTGKKRKFKDKIIELRRLFAKENSLKTVTPICPNPNDLINAVVKFRNDYVKVKKLN